MIKDLLLGDPIIDKNYIFLKVIQVIKTEFNQCTKSNKKNGINFEFFVIIFDFFKRKQTNESHDVVLYVKIRVIFTLKRFKSFL